MRRYKDMKKIFYSLLAIAIFSICACTLYIPYDYNYDYGPIRVVFNVEPESAHIMLNGRFIGEAYEFSNPEAALKLNSKNNELVVKKEGYIEEEIDLFNYATRQITISLKMRQEKADVAEGDLTRRSEPEKEKDPAYKAKTVEVKTPPEEAEKEIEPDKIEAVDMTLEISPPEAAIYLNGNFWGISPKSGKIENLKLKPDKYTLEITKPGYRTYKKEIEIKNQKELTLTIKLEKTD